MNDNLRYVGKAVPRKDAREIVTGRTVFVTDRRVLDMLYGKVLRSPHAHALIKSVDKSKALALKGVKAVLTWEDAPDWRGGTPRVVRVMDRKVRWVGDAVALVAAATEQIAEEALGLIDVEYEVLPAVFDMEEALKPGAPQLYDEFPDNVVTPGAPFLGPKNLQAVAMGDTGKGFAEADVITEGTFGYEGLPNPMPPESPGIIASWEEPNKVTFWVSNQSPYMDKTLLWFMMGRKVEIKTLGGPVGGSYGS